RCRRSGRGGSGPEECRAAEPEDRRTDQREPSDGRPVASPHCVPSGEGPPRYAATIRHTEEVALEQPKVRQARVRRYVQGNATFRVAERPARRGRTLAAVRPRLVARGTRGSGARRGRRPGGAGRERHGAGGRGSAP